jgi:hypothetical protein
MVSLHLLMAPINTITLMEEPLLSSHMGMPYAPSSPFPTPSPPIVGGHNTIHPMNPLPLQVCRFLAYTWTFLQPKFKWRNIDVIQLVWDSTIEKPILSIPWSSTTQYYATIGPTTSWCKFCPTFSNTIVQAFE